MTDDLLFDNFVFHEGLNITVRRGDRTKEFAECDRVYLKSTRHDDRIKSELLTSIKLRFDEIPEELLVLEHDPTCQTYEGLLKELTRVYFTFNTYDLVTIVFFIPHLEDMKQQTLWDNTSGHYIPISEFHNEIIYNAIKHVDGC